MFVDLDTFPSNVYRISFTTIIGMLTSLGGLISFAGLIVTTLASRITKKRYEQKIAKLVKSHFALLKPNWSLEDIKSRI